MAFAIQQLTSYVGFCCSFVINTLLMYMIRKKTTKQLGSYVYLMLSFSIFELVFSTVDVLNQPMIFVGNGEFVFFSPNPLHLKAILADHFNLINFACSGITISLLAIHFFYRYMAICNNKAWLHLFEMPRFYGWIVIFVLFGLEWYLATLWLGKNSDSAVCNVEINEQITENFDVDPKHIVFVGIRYHAITAFETTLCGKSIMLAVILLKIVIISCVIVIYCGLKTWREIRKKKRVISKKTLDLQRQFFRALVAQTLIPIFLLYLPLFTMLLAPIFMANLQNIDVIIQFAFVFYPLLDPIAVLVIVKDYRNSIKTGVKNILTEFMWKRLLKFLKLWMPYILHERAIESPPAPPVLTVPRFIY